MQEEVGGEQYGHHTLQVNNKKRSPLGFFSSPPEEGPLRSETLYTNPRVSSPHLLLHLLAGACRRPHRPPRIRLERGRSPEAMKVSSSPLLNFVAFSVFVAFRRSPSGFLTLFSLFFWPTVQYSQPYHWMPEEARSGR